MFNQFDIDQAIKLIDNGFDGSNTNKVALIKAKKVLTDAAKFLKEFANKKPDTAPANYCTLIANNYLKIARKTSVI